MAREPKCRQVEFIPKVVVFNPAGIPKSSLNETVVKVEELEAIRLKDLLGLEQEECAEKMGVSRPTFQRILTEAREKIAGALIEGKTIRIAGGDYCLGQGHCRRMAHSHKRREDCPYDSLFEPQDNAGTKQVGKKIAICTSSNSMSSLIDGRFGRCAYFMLWDEEQGDSKAIANNGPELNYGAGTEAARELLKQGVGILICNKIGRHALTVFLRSGARVYNAAEGLDAETVLEQYRAGELPLIETANN